MHCVVAGYCGRARMKRRGGCRGRAAANSGALREHFGALTAALLTPFAAFWQPTPPPPGSGPVPTCGPPHLPPFSHADFLESLAAPQAAFPQILLDRFVNQVALLSRCLHAMPCLAHQLALTQLAARGVACWELR